MTYIIQKAKNKNKTLQINLPSTLTYKNQLAIDKFPNQGYAQILYKKHKLQTSAFQPKTKPSHCTNST